MQYIFFQIQHSYTDIAPIRQCVGCSESGKDVGQSSIIITLYLLKLLALTKDTSSYKKLEHKISFMRSA